MVYNETKKKFLLGYDASFADAALRLGKVFEYGIGAEANPVAAYCLYLEADYAAKIRADHSDFFGDHSVVKRTGQALERVARKLPAEFFRDVLWLDTPRPVVDFLEDGYRCELSFQKKRGRRGVGDRHANRDPHLSGCGISAGEFWRTGRGHPLQGTVPENGRAGRI